jgi:hypothetical protein
MMGEYVCHIDYEGEVLGTTFDREVVKRAINGGAPFILDGPQELIMLMAYQRDKAPIIGISDTKVATVHKGEHIPRWTELRALTGKEHVLVPGTHHGHWALFETSIVKLAKASMNIPKFIPGEKPMLMTLQLDSGRGKSYWCPGGVVHV